MIGAYGGRGHGPDEKPRNSLIPGHLLHGGGHLDAHAVAVKESDPGVDGFPPKMAVLPRAEPCPNGLCMA